MQERVQEISLPGGLTSVGNNNRLSPFIAYCPNLTSPHCCGSGCAVLTGQESVNKLNSLTFCFPTVRGMRNCSRCSSPPFLSGSSPSHHFLLWILGSSFKRPIMSKGESSRQAAETCLATQAPCYLVFLRPPYHISYPFSYHVVN